MWLIPIKHPELHAHLTLPCPALVMPSLTWQLPLSEDNQPLTAEHTSLLLHKGLCDFTRYPLPTGGPQWHYPWLRASSCKACVAPFLVLLQFVNIWDLPCTGYEVLWGLVWLYPSSVTLEPQHWIRHLEAEFVKQTNVLCVFLCI